MSNEIDEWVDAVIAQPINVSLISNKDGSNRQDTENFIRVLEQDVRFAGRFRLNELSQAIELTLPLPWADGEGTCRASEADLIELVCVLEQDYGLRSKKKAKDAVVAVASRHKRDPVAERLDALPQWDGQERAGHLFSWFLGARDDEYTRSVERLLFSGAIMRTYHPGSKFDYMAVLVGGQGIGKSTLARKLALEDEWFTDGIMGIGTKEAAELVQGRLIIEIAELDALKGKRLETTKAFITRTSDDYRAAYGDRVEQHPRRCVLVGTTNADRFLSDMTGNRRFVPVKCGEVEPALDLFGPDAEAAIEQAWAEMLHLYRQDGNLPLVLPREAMRRANATQEVFELDDPRVGELEAWLSDRKPGERVCAAQILEEALCSPRPQKRYEVNDIHGIMKHRFPEWQMLQKKKRIGNFGVQFAYEKADDKG